MIKSKSKAILSVMILGASIVLGACGSDEEGSKSEAEKTIYDYAKEGKTSGEDLGDKKVKVGKKDSIFMGMRYKNIDDFIKDFELIYGDIAGLGLTKGEAVSLYTVYGYGYNKVNLDNVSEMMENYKKQYKESNGKEPSIKEQRFQNLITIADLSLRLYYYDLTLNKVGYDYSKVSKEDRLAYNVVSKRYKDGDKEGYKEAKRYLKGLKEVRDTLEVYDKELAEKSGDDDESYSVDMRSYVIKDKTLKGSEIEGVQKGLKSGKYKVGGIYESSYSASGEQTKGYKYLIKVVDKKQASDEVIKSIVAKEYIDKVKRKEGESKYLKTTLNNLGYNEVYNTTESILSDDIMDEILSSYSSLGGQSNTIYRYIIDSADTYYMESMTNLGAIDEVSADYMLTPVKEGEEDEK